MPAEAAAAPAAETLAEMIAPARTALAIIDIQHDFAAPDGAMGVMGADLSGVAQVTAQCNRLAAAARGAGATVMYARVVTTPQTDAENLKALYRRQGFPDAAVAICREGTAGADYHGVSPEPGDIEIQKRLFSSFVGTDLEAQLRARGIDTLVIAGLTTECCVDCTARDAFHLGFHVLLVEDACAAYGAELHRSALASLTATVALPVKSDEVVAAWS